MVNLDIHRFTLGIISFLSNSFHYHSRGLDQVCENLDEHMLLLMFEVEIKEKKNCSFFFQRTMKWSFSMFLIFKFQLKIKSKFSQQSYTNNRGKI